STCRYQFNIDRLEKKYEGEQADVEIDLRTFDMFGTDSEVKKEFKRLSEMGDRFSFATMSSPVVNVAELETPQLVEKCLVLNHIFRAKYQSGLALTAPSPRLALPAPSRVNGDTRI
ncbi:hypothetical protein PENTCL1PPCAC_706, partial [Pristionchus entomophagus]